MELVVEDHDVSHEVGVWVISEGSRGLKVDFAIVRNGLNWNIDGLLGAEGQQRIYLLENFTQDLHRIVWISFFQIYLFSEAVK